MAEKPQSQLWQYIATGALSFIASAILTFATMTYLGVSNDAIDARVEKALIPVYREQDEQKVATKELTKAITELRVQIARWADATAKKEQQNK